MNLTALEFSMWHFFNFDFPELTQNLKSVSISVEDADENS
jgi:hypothetical protein